VIQALHHEQNIWNMGGLSQKMRTTYWTFLIGTLALCGVPPLSGFFSKDEILATAYQQSTALFVLAGVVAGLTAFYMFRLVFVAFLGPAKSPLADHAHESPRVMTVPLVALAVPSLLAGFWGIDLFIGRAFLKSAGETLALPWYEQILAPFNHSPLAALFGLFAAVIGFSVALRLYSKASQDPLPQRLGALSRALRNGFYFDEFYNALIAATQENFAKLADWFDRWIIAGVAVKGTHGTTELLGRALRMLQTGNLQTYAFLFVVGVTLLLYFTLK
jgi:NADH-quinone oxidoreductase subunit L